MKRSKSADSRRASAALYLAIYHGRVFGPQTRERCPNLPGRLIVGSSKARDLGPYLEQSVGGRVQPSRHLLEATLGQERRVERIVGSLFIVATVSSSLGFVLLDPILDDADVLGSVAANDTSVIFAAFLLLINAVAVVVIPVLLFPTLRKHNAHLARLYPGARIVESVVLVIGVIGLLSLVTLSRDYAPSGSDAASFRASANALLAVYDWGALLGILFFFSLAGLLLNYLLLRSGLVPRWLAVWGLIGVVLLLVEGGFEAFDVDGLVVMSLPFAVQEMVFAVWLIARGFAPAVESDAVTTALGSPTGARSE